MRGQMIDAATRDRLFERFGPSVAGWCEGLPELVSRLARKWDLEVVRPVSNDATSCVLVCERRGDGAVVLKVSPDRSLIMTEAAALEVWRASGRVPELFEFDEEGGALLMEALRPGTALTGGLNRSRLREVVGLVRDLHAGAGEKTLARFPPLLERVEFIFEFWGKRLRKPEVAAVIPQGLPERSLAAARKLATRSGHRVLLHGDLHVRNVLDGGPDRGFVAIDPRACVGDPAFDLIDWVFAEDGETALARRADRLAEEAGVDPSSLLAWCGCTALLDATRLLSWGDGSMNAVRALLAFADNEV